MPQQRPSGNGWCDSPPHTASLAAVSDISPAGEAGAGGLRASHADRDAVVEQLRVAAGDGRLTPEELDQRLEVALTARTYAELATLTADLPAAGPPATVASPPAKDLMRFDQRGSNTTRS